MNEDVPGKLEPLEKMIADGSTQFTTTLTAGELLLFANMHSSVDLEPKLLGPFPKMKAFFDHMCALPQLQDILLRGVGSKPYLKRV